MSENLFAISKINDFIFCPVSIYFHDLDNDTDTLMYQDSYQINGTHAHSAVDNGRYSDKINVIQGMTVSSTKYGLIGKIDVFDVDRGILTERKKHINKIYDGYVFQIYAQYFGLVELGYDVKEIRLYSYDNNKVYPVLLPEKDSYMFNKFEATLKNILSFSFDGFKQTSVKKCEKCIYEPLCSYSLMEGKLC